MFKKIKKIPKFIKEVREELKKVSWVSKEELNRATVMVIVVSSILTIYLAGVDFVLVNLVKLLLR